ncbi:MAG: beta-ketoacyl-[acyl-carrier-protein] synthase family protein [Candidatus Omnitrophica bacterium]|nr:beta-ketoacyl-[acyl-carrier-protein] synthase family protein [Candidatus Omnitrophota bacterium]
MKKRVVITGLGVVSSVGIGKENFWKSILEGKSGISEVGSFDTKDFAVHNAGEIKDFDPLKYLPKDKISNLGRSSYFGVIAAKLALEDAGLTKEGLDKEATMVCMGTTMGESGILERLNRNFIEKGIDGLDVSLIPNYPCNNLASSIASEFSLEGVNYVIPNACAAGNFAIGYAFDLISNGEADMAFAGGSDGFSRIAFIGFSRMFAVAPERCQPFDKNRKGMMVAEGAGVVLLESLDSAKKRKANIYAEILGYGISSDARHMTAPYSEGIKEAMQSALKESNIDASQVDYISAHGTGTAVNDREECLAVKKVLGDNFKNVPMSSIKSMLGHTMGAASAIEAITCCLVIKDDVLPPTINYETPDPDCDIDCVPNKSRRHKVNIALNNASAFGGNNSCLVLKKITS